MWPCLNLTDLEALVLRRSPDLRFHSRTSSRAGGRDLALFLHICRALTGRTDILSKETTMPLSALRYRILLGPMLLLKSLAIRLPYRNRHHTPRNSFARTETLNDHLLRDIGLERALLPYSAPFSGGETFRRITSVPEVVVVTQQDDRRGEE